MARYRRYWINNMPDGSTRVVSHGPIVQAGRSFWSSTIGTWFVFVLAFCFLSPWPGWSNATTWWAVSWATGLTIIWRIGKGHREQSKSA